MTLCSDSFLDLFARKQITVDKKPCTDYLNNFFGIPCTNKSETKKQFSNTCYNNLPSRFVLALESAMINLP